MAQSNYTNIVVAHYATCSVATVAALFYSGKTTIADWCKTDWYRCTSVGMSSQTPGLNLKWTVKYKETMLTCFAFMWWLFIYIKKSWACWSFLSVYCFCKQSLLRFVWPTVQNPKRLSLLWCTINEGRRIHTLENWNQRMVVILTDKCYKCLIHCCRLTFYPSINQLIIWEPLPV